MKRLLLCVALLSSVLAWGQVYSPTPGPITASGSSITVPNLYGGYNASFEEIPSGTPATVSVTVQGCMRGGTCDSAADTNNNTSAVIRFVTFTKAYSYFKITASWTGGTNPKIQIWPYITTSRLNSGGGSGTVTSFSAGTLSPLFTTSVATATTTPALSFTLSNAAAHTVFGNSTGGSAAPAFNSDATTINTSAPLGGGGAVNIGGTLSLTCATCVTSAASLTNNALVIGGGLQASSTISADSTTTHALFATAGAPAFRAIVAGDLPNIPLNQIVSPTGAITAIADGDNPLVFNTAATTSGRVGFSFTEATAATSAGSPGLVNIQTLATSTMVPLTITGGSGKSQANAPDVLDVTGGAGGAAGGATNPGKKGSGPAFIAGNGSSAGATSGTGGAGGDFSITTGTGGLAAVGSTTGKGGDVLITLGAAGGTGTAGAPGQITVTGATVGAALTTPLLNLAETWNTTGLVDAGIFENITNTASAQGSKLIDLQASSASKFSVDTSGIMSSKNTVFVTSNFTFNTNTSLTNITGLSWTFPASTNHSFECQLTYSQATAAAADAIGVQVTTTAPTNGYFHGIVGTSATAVTSNSLPTLNSTTATNVVTFTPSAAGTIGTTADMFPIQLWGTVEGGAGTWTLNIMILTGSTSDAITVYRGSYCAVQP